MSELRAAIQTIWCDILKIDHCKPDDNFFDLGGNSLQVIKILNALDERFGLEIEIETIYDELTLAELTSVALKVQGQTSLA